MASSYSRCSGILLHPTSLPGRYGIGDLGEWAYRFVDLLEAAGQTVWQVLPLNPTGYADSPYQSLSTFAGNTNLISLDALVDDGWLTRADLADAPDFPAERVDYGPVIDYHNRLLSRAYDRFEAQADGGQRQAFDLWRERNAYWLDDFALFAALKESHALRPWTEWPVGEALRQPDALQAAGEKHARRVAEHGFRQWVFFTQWLKLKAYANGKGIRIVGDIPIFVAHDSADVWANPDLFYLDRHGSPTVIAGVPPDYFSPTGQRWGNPLYRWERMKPDYTWWIRRVRAAITLVDMVRIDHFRGFDAYYEIPASEATAEKGRWVRGPAYDFFDALARAIRDSVGKNLDDLIIAEDLGVITRSVMDLRDNLGLPGMNVLQFAFVNEGRFLPHYHRQNAIVYTGTHDNNTMLGWWEHESSDAERDFLRRYVGKSDIAEPNWEVIRLGMMSVAHTLIMPLQDLLGLGAEARMNTPGTSSGNWTWRVTPDGLDGDWRARLAEMTRLYGRWPKAQEDQYPVIMVEEAGAEEGVEASKRQSV